MTDIEQIRASIERRLAELAEEVESLQSTRAELIAKAAAANGSALPAKPSAGRQARAPKSTPPRARRAPAARSTPVKRPRTPGEPLSRQTVEALLEQTGGLSASALAKQAGTTYAAAKDVLDALAASGLARSSGAGRASVWRLLTDEERIAARTAELEAQLAAVAAARAGRS